MTSRIAIQAAAAATPLVLERAHDFIARGLGWLGRRHLDADAALWLHPCRAVHSIGMRVPIDVVFLDADGMVLRVVAGLPPGRAVWLRGARSVIELPAGGARRHALVPGLRLPLPPAASRHVAGLPAAPWLVLACAMVACVVAGCPGSPARAAPPLVDESPAPAPAVEVVFETEWTPDPRRLVEDPIPTAAPPVVSRAQGGAPRPVVAPAPITSAPVPTATAVLVAALPTSAASAQVPAPGHPAAASAACTSALPALALTRPLAPETLARALEEADGLYHGKHWARAMEAFCGLVEVDPGNRMAWLRIGNLHHQRSRLAPATHAYRQAARAPDAADGHASAPEPTPVRARALANLAAVALELARESLGELQALNLPAQASAMQLAEQITGEMRQLAGSVSRTPPATRGPVEVLGGRGGRSAAAGH